MWGNSEAGANGEQPQPLPPASEVMPGERLFQTLAERALVGVYIVQDGVFRYVNPALATIFGYKPQEIIDRMGPYDLVHVDDRKRVASEIRQRLDGEVEVSHYFLTGIRKDGEQISCEVLGRRADFGGRPAVIGTLLDVTERRRAERVAREQQALAEALRDTATVLNSTLNLDQVLERILDNVGRVVPHDGANIMLVRHGEARVVRCQGDYDKPEIVLQLRFSLEETNNFKLMRETGEPSVIANTLEDDDWISAPATSWIRSYVGAPIIREGEVIGFLNLDSRTPGFFDAVHAERLHAFADQVAIALHNARLYHELANYSEVLEQAVHARTVELQSTMEKLAVILNNSPDAILFLRPDCTIETANPAFFELFGYAEADVLDQSPLMLVVPPQRVYFRRALKLTVIANSRQRLELTAQCCDGTSFDAHVALAPVREEGEVQGIVCSLRDISDLKEVERMKDRFVSNVSHELRTPITSLKLYHTLLEHNLENGAHYLESLGREINRLNAIIEDLLRLSSLDRAPKEMTWELVDLCELVERYLADRQPLAREKEIDLRLDLQTAAATVRVDTSLLEQVLGILLTNALNYTPPDGKVTVAVLTRDENGEKWIGCRVSDTGPGVPPAEREHLFDRFFRGSAARAVNIPGTGLGLAIAREIVERHHGSIDVESSGEPGGGACFTFWLPAASVT